MPRGLADGGEASYNRVMALAFPLMMQTAARRALAARQRNGQRAARLEADSIACARLLADRFGASEVWVFGSTVTGLVHERSDLDLAVRGLDSGAYFPALAALMDVTAVDVDLVRLEEAFPDLAASIARGRRLL
jgi:predicted nucleotidyltransferase